MHPFQVGVEAEPGPDRRAEAAAEAGRDLLPARERRDQDHLGAERLHRYHFDIEGSGLARRGLRVQVFRPYPEGDREFR